MKKIGFFLIAISIITQLFSVPVFAQDNVLKKVEVYDYYESSNKTIEVYFQKDEPYVRPENLASLTGYSLVQDGDKIVFEKKNGAQTVKRVSVKDNQINYREFNDSINMVTYNDEIYISLVPTIDYLDSRLRMFADEKMCLFSSEKTFSQLVNQVNYDMSHGGNIEDYANTLETGAAWVWLLVNGKLLSALPNERSERLAFSLLVEEDADSYTINMQNAFLNFFDKAGQTIDFGKAVTAFKDFEAFDEKFKTLLREKDTLMKYGGYYLDCADRFITLQNQIEQLYFRNIENAGKTLLNSKMNILQPSERLYQDLNKIVQGFQEKQNKLSEDVTAQLYQEEIIDFAMDNLAKFAASKVISYIPALSVGMSIMNIYGELCGVNDGALSTLDQKDYSKLQSKVAAKLEKYNNQLRKGGSFNENQILEYVELARMYYHIKTAYYHMYNEYHSDPLFEDSYEMYLDIEKEIDQYGSDVYKMDIPDVNPTDITQLSFIEVKMEEPIQNAGKSIQDLGDNVLYLKYIDTKIKIPDEFTFHSEGSSPQAPQYDFFYELNNTSDFFEKYRGQMDVSNWNIYDYPQIDAERYFGNLRLSLSENKKRDQEANNDSVISEYFGTERKYIELVYFKLDGEDLTPDFTITFVDLDNDICEYKIYFSLYSKDDPSDHSITDEEFKKIDQLAKDMITSCDYLD